MACVIHFSTGGNTGIICPYDAADYHTWKSHEADLLLNNKDKTKLTGADKAYRVKWKQGAAKMNNRHIMKNETFENEYSDNFEVIEGGSRPIFKVNRGGGFTVTIDGKQQRIGHLDAVARPLWENKDTRTH